VRSYYSTVLAGVRLRRCYEIAPPRVQQYLREELRFVCQRVAQSDVVLELGCGYGRLVWQLAPVARLVVGIDTSSESLRLAQTLSDPHLRCAFARMDAARLAFRPHAFDVVVCVQNGVCAFHADPVVLLAEALRVVRSPGRLLFSSYSERFWHDRLDWFRRQAAAGLVGAVDEHATRPGTIVCHDGFTVGTMSPAAFRAVCTDLGVTPHLTEVDDSSLFCEVHVDSSGELH
jgi:SAM-dependent methyltransferase